MRGASETTSDSAAAIQHALWRVRIIGGITVGLSPWIYMVAIILLDRLVDWQRFIEPFERIAPKLMGVALAGCLLAFPAAWLLQALLARRVVSTGQETAAQASSLSAAGLVSLTVVHTPAVLALVYYLTSADATRVIAMEFWAFLLYLPMQWQVNRQIRALDRDA